MKTIIADSSQLTVFDECPVKWHYLYNEQICKSKTKLFEKSDIEIELGNDEVAKGQPKVNYRDMGTFVHKVLEYRYAQRLKINECIEQTVAEYQLPNSEINLNTKELDTVIRTCLLYDANYSVHGDFDIRDGSMVEVGFSEEIYNDGEYQFILEGRIDLAEAFLNRSIAVIGDHKCQGRKKNLYRRSIQFKNYALIRKTQLLVINYIRFTAKPDKDTFVRELVSFGKADHEAWKYELLNMFFRIAEFKEKFDNPTDTKSMYLNYFKKRSSCSGFYGECEFTPLCDEPNQNVLVNIKGQNYEHRKPFRPW